MRSNKKNDVFWNQTNKDKQIINIKSGVGLERVKYNWFLEFCSAFGLPIADMHANRQSVLDFGVKSEIKLRKYKSFYISFLD